SITIVNATVPAGGAGFFYFGDLGNFTLDDGQNQQVNDLLPGDYAVFQDVPAGWVVDISCVGGDSTVVDNSVTVHLDANEDVVCTFNNTYVGGAVTIVNATNPPGATGFFYFGDFGNHSLDDGQSFAEADLMPGDYAVFQDVPAGWVVDINCVGGDSTVVDNSVTVHLDANEDVVCTFANTDDSVPNEMPVVVFFDNFEGDMGWTSNPNGTDTATTGQWERGNPRRTHYRGIKQQG
ncbi:MAG: hypothetical protein GY803_05770, partial [Chloroflexi bacterium]|nr:hypothetical protein [Chloroflexota bacterium]